MTRLKSDSFIAENYGATQIAVRLNQVLCKETATPSAVKWFIKNMYICKNALRRRISLIYGSLLNPTRDWPLRDILNKHIKTTCPASLNNHVEYFVETRFINTSFFIKSKALYSGQCVIFFLIFTYRNY